MRAERDALKAKCAELEERLDEIIFYIPKVPTEPYEKELAQKLESARAVIEFVVNNSGTSTDYNGRARNWLANNPAREQSIHKFDLDKNDTEREQIAEALYQALLSAAGSVDKRSATYAELVEALKAYREWKGR